MQHARMRTRACQMRSVAALMFVALVGIAPSADVSAEILFQDDFEGKNAIGRRVIDLNQMDTSSQVGALKISDNTDKHEVLREKGA